MKTSQIFIYKTALVLFIIFQSVIIGFSQNVGINTTSNSPDASAMLDISSAAKGLLIPRVSLTSLTDASTIPTPATSLLIYNTDTNTSTLLGAGYYYNSGTTTSPAWVKLISTKDTVLTSKTPNGDIIKLAKFPMGEISMYNNATSTSCVANTWVKAAGTSAISAGAWDFWRGTSPNTNNRLTYNGNSEKMFHIACTISLTNTGGNSSNMLSGVYKNGVLLTNGVVKQRLSGGTDFSSTAIHVMTNMVPGDYIELWINSSVTETITVTYMNMFAMGVSMGMD